MSDCYPKYSVLMSIYSKDNPSWLKNSIDSMLAQTVEPSEFVIIKDGPLTRELEEVLSTYDDEIFRIISLKKNVGLGIALKLGIEECSFGWIARMDADDYCPPERIKKQFDILKRFPDLDIIGSNAIEFSGTIDNVISRVVLPETNDQIISFSKKRCPYRHPSILFKKEKVLDAGNYKDCYLCEDYDLYTRMEMIGARGYNVQEPLLYIRVSDDFYKRRGGIRYLKSILRFKSGLFACNYYSWKDFIFSSVAHIVVCLMPSFIRKKIYIMLLRKD